MKLAFFIIALSILIYLGICIFFYLIQQRSLFPARKIALDAKLGFTLEHEEIFLDTPDGARLSAALFEANNPRGVVLYFHGNGSNLLDMEEAAAPFVAGNYSFLAMDYRSYGKSTGKLSEENLFKDAELFLDYLKNQGWQESEIILYGRSIGTGIATYLASKTQVPALILYSPYVSMKRLVAEKVPLIPSNLILQYPLNSAEYLQAVDCPVLLLHGELDTLIPIHHAEKLAEIKGKLVRFPSGTHRNLGTLPGFWQSIEGFLAT